MTRTRKVETSELAVLWRQLESLLRGGLSLPDALSALGRDAASAPLRSLVESLHAAVTQGEPLSAALARRPEAFDPATVACVEAGERSGDLPAAARILAGYGQRVHTMRLRGRMVLIYPVILLIAALVSFSVFARMILPVMERLYSGLGQGASLPLMTHAAVFITRSFSILAPVLLVVLAALVLLYRLPGRFPGLHARIDGLLLRIPLWSRYYRSLMLARFSRTLGVLLSSEVPLHEALVLAGRAGGNTVLLAEATAAGAAVQDGGKASESLKAGPALTESLVWSMKISEERGDLEETVESLADYFDEAASIGASTFLNAVEPSAVLVLGVIFAAAIIGMVAPLFHLVGLIGY